MENLKFDLQVLTTDIHIQYGSFFDFETDVLISPSDAYISASQGMSRLICLAAGDEVRNAVRKFSLPMSPGSIVITNAGKLPTKYIFHVAILDFATHQNSILLIHRVVWEILQLATQLHLERCVLPIFYNSSNGQADHESQVLVSQLSEIPVKQLLEFLLRSVACYLAMKPCSVRSITIVLDDAGTISPKGTQETLAAELKPFFKKLDNWRPDIERCNARLGHLIPLDSLMVEDNNVKEAIGTGIEIERQSLHKIFIGADDMSEILAAVHEGIHTPLSRSEQEHRRTNIIPVINQFKEEIAFKEKLRRTLNRRLQMLELQRAREGLDTRAEISMEIEDIQEHMNELQHAISQEEHQIELLKTHQEAAERDLKTLTQEEQATP